MTNDEAASATSAGNLFHSGMMRATNDPWSCDVTAPMARHLKTMIGFCLTVSHHQSKFFRRHRRVIMGNIIHYLKYGVLAPGLYGFPSYRLLCLRYGIYERDMNVSSMSVPFLKAVYFQR